MKTDLRDALRNSSYVGPRTSRAIATLLLIAGIGVGIWGVVYAVNGATQSKAMVAVPVSLEMDDGVAGVVDDRVPVRVTGIDLPANSLLQATDGGLQLVQSFGNLSRWTGFLARGDAALFGLGFGACALLLVPVVNSVAAGEPFRRGNAARIGWTAGIVGVVGMLAPTLPALASVSVLDGLGLASPGSPFVIGLGFDLAPIGLSALIFVIAEAFRRGAQISADAAGLV